MGTDDLFKKRREERKKRKYEYKPPKANSFLIVTEGKRTEPYYFKGLQSKILEKIGGRVDVVEIPRIDVEGEGCSTGKLIEVTDELIKEANIIYQNVWVVFDKDDFQDFDCAIKDGVRKGYNIAWSNQSFEYWLFLHFEYSDAALHRDIWNEKLDILFKRYNLGDGCYRKNYENIFELVNTYDGVKNAIKHAKRRMAEFNQNNCVPSEYDPGTMVHVLVEKLMNYLDE